MRCRASREYISRSLDGELSESESLRLERHLAGCDECRTLSRDLRRIVAGAARLETPEPSAEVWLKIRAGLSRGKEERAGREVPKLRRHAWTLGLSPLRLAGVAALALAFVATGLVVGRRLGRGPAPLGPEARERYTLAKLDEAERYYQQAIKSLAEAFASGKGTLAPEVEDVFDRNLSVIDATIQACRQAVLEEPGDLEARNYLMAAYTRKITLLDSALDLQRRDRDAAGSKTIL